MTYDSSTSSFQQRVSVGTRLNGIYEIDRLIGSGGMGEIYRGHVIQTGDEVAIKLLLPEFAANEAALALFRKEAQALHRLQHDAIVRYYVFTIEPVLQRPYLAMEFINGRSLSNILSNDGPLVFEAVAALTLRIANGLQAAHELGIIHRDVTPDNIIVPDADVARAKIIDFGIARLTQLQDGTVIGSGFAGKYNYVSPEQLGLFGGDVTPKSDIYSLGLVMVQALTGRAIDMAGSPVEIVEKRRKVPDLGAMDMRVRPLLERMLQPDPANRPDSIAEIAEWSLAYVRPAAKPKTAVEKRVRKQRVARAVSPRRWLRRLAAALAVIAVGAGGAGYYVYFGPNGVVAPSAPISSETKPGSAFNPGTSSTLGKAIPEVPLRPPPPSPAPTRADQIKSYVEQYNGGDCFFLMPVAVSATAAALEGFGASTDAFERLDKAFKRANGFEASIGVRLVSAAQCPAITFLSRLRDDRIHAPRLSIDKVNLASGESLEGTVEDYGGRNIELLLVSDSGMVQNVTNLLKPGLGEKTFAIGMKRTMGAEASQPQLLIVVATAQPLPILRPSGPVAADQFFPAVLNEAARANQPLSAVARYFNLGR
jgi:serine/threonine protein kinase